MLVAPEVSGTVTVNLKNVTVREALETLRELYGYEFKVQGTRIYIQPNTMQTRIFQLNYLAGKRVGAIRCARDVRARFRRRSLRTRDGRRQRRLPTPVQPVPPSSAARFRLSKAAISGRDLNKALTSIVGTQDGRAVIVNPASGVVVVKAFPADLRAVENYLKLTQLIVERQVMLEAKILEVSLSEEFQAGVNWAAFGGATAAATPSARSIRGRR
jgi:MSHA biogenesis protein MshL